MRKFVILLFLAVMAFAQSGTVETVPHTDTLSAAAKSDSIAAEYKIEALKKALAGVPENPVPMNAADYQPPDLGKVAVRMAVGLGVILILLYVLYILAKKIRGVESPNSTQTNSAVQLLDSKFLGGGQKVFLIRAGAERILVVGSSADGLRTLSEIQGEEAKYILETYNSRPITPAQFSATVDHLLRRFKKEG
ncbi:hypothetical protein AGMMS49938_11830 [Fibrobacterales bacterium]|nr:hypothetical protein AGMMS49938_11830 [Fibrobacterales bacterium]